MRIGSLSAARPAYYDRNAASTVAYDAAIYGPHTNTTRITYTVATGKKCIIEMSNAGVTNQTAATSTDAAYSIVRITSGSNIVDTANSTILTSATLKQPYLSYNSTNVTLYASETISGFTSNTSTGGTVLHYVAYKGTTFDA